MQKKIAANATSKERIRINGFGVGIGFEEFV